MLKRVGLYYPYVHVRDESWTKAAALYWPKIARVVPADFPVADSDTVRALADGLDFLVSVDPIGTAQAVAPVFLDLLEQYEREIRFSYRLPSGAWEESRSSPVIPNSEPSPAYWENRGPNVNNFPCLRLAGLYWDEVSADLREALFTAGLAVASSRSELIHQESVRPWVTMDPCLAWVYKCAFVAELARRGGFVPVTDQEQAHLMPDAWDVNRVAVALLGDRERDDGDEWEARRTFDGHCEPELAETVGVLALRIVMPQDLASVPVEKIILLRSRYAEQFDRFSAEVGECVAMLREELSDVSLREARDSYVGLEIERRFNHPLEELRLAMTGLGIDSALSAVNLKFELPTAVSMAAGGAISGFQVLGATAGAAFALKGLHRSVSQQRRSLAAGSPISYLLSVERTLDPASLLRRLTERLDWRAYVGWSPR